MKPFHPTRPQLLQNASYIVAEDLYLVSAHQHDYVGHKWVNAAGRDLAYLRGRSPSLGNP